MKMAHLLLEMYCEYEKNDGSYCTYGKDMIGLHCFENKCKFLSYTYCPNELAYSGEEGIVLDQDSFIGFGGEMDTELASSNYENEHQKCLKRWEKICKEKIYDAYESYMHHKRYM